MRRIAALITSDADRARIARLSGRAADVRLCPDAPGLLRVAVGGRCDAVVTSLTDAAGDPLAPTLLAINARCPALPIFLSLALSPKTTRELLATVAAGVRGECVLSPHEEIGESILRMLERRLPPSAAATLLRRLVPGSPFALHPFLAACAAKGAPALHVATAAAWTGVSARTIERRLRRAGMPAARVVLRACVALHAAWWLDVHGWPVKRIVGEMGFSHAGAVTRILQRYCGCAPRVLAEQGGFPAALGRVAAALAPDAALAPSAGSHR